MLGRSAKCICFLVFAVVLVGGVASGADNSANEAQVEPDQSQLQFRTWTDSTEKFQTEAALLDFKDGKVRLTKKDGGIVLVDIERLSSIDREWIRYHLDSLKTSGETPATTSSKPDHRPKPVVGTSKRQHEMAQLARREREIADSYARRLKKYRNVDIDSLTKDPFVERKGEHKHGYRQKDGTILSDNEIFWLIEQRAKRQLKEDSASGLSGTTPVRVTNPNSYSVKVTLRSGTATKDFPVAANDNATVHVRDGRYDVFFQYSDDPDGLYQGDSFTLSGNGVEIQLVKAVGGNYGIRKIK